MSGTEKVDGMERMDATPQLVYALLYQLVDVVGVNESDIWLGDPYRIFSDTYYDLCAGAYPNVHYVDGRGLNGREQTDPSATQVLKFSNGLATSSLPSHYIDAAYLINMPCLKTHDVGGITIAAKNHQGSVLEPGDFPDNQSAMYLHPYLPGNSADTGKYRHLVDYMGHKNLGGKTLIYIVDGIWAGRNWEGWVEKWQIAPFNNDYPSSLFLSQDAVAIESVCYDFLLAEYETKTDQYPYMSGTDDYLRQSADPANWPAGVEYDPEGDGTNISSLGVYEHWNNATDKKYSRNLNTTTGTGIELKKVDNVLGIISNNNPSNDYLIYPNPFSEKITLKFNNSSEKAKLNIYDTNGKLVFQTNITESYTWEGTTCNGTKIIPGSYIMQAIDLKSNKTILKEKIIYTK
jgi:hypothetical protein